MGIDAPAPTVGLVLELDPELGSGIGAAQWEKARRACRGCIVWVPRGVWQLSPEFGEQVGRLGVVIVEGMVCREVALGERHMFELLGPGDVIAPPGLGEPRRLGGSVALTAAVDTIAVGLGESFLRAAVRWPCLLDAVLGRLEVQRQRLAVQGLIAHLPRAEDRALLALWLLADRWGRATPEGTVLSLALTHELLGQLTGSRRSTATVAVSALESDGSIARLGDGSWLLTEQAEQNVAALARNSSSAGLLGESFMLRQLVVDTHEHARTLRAEALQTRAQRRPSGQDIARSVPPARAAAILRNDTPEPASNHGSRA